MINITLTKAEVAFLRRLIKPFLDYYGLLAQSSKCTPASRAKWEEVRALEQKLGAGVIQYD